MHDAARTPVTWSLPHGIRSAIDAEAARRDSTPSRVVEAFFLTYLPTFIAESVTASLTRAHAEQPRATQEPLEAGP